MTQYSRPRSSSSRILTDSTTPPPDNVMMLVTVTSIKNENWLIEELGKFILFLKELGVTYRIQHVAFTFSKYSSVYRMRSKNLDLSSPVKFADVTGLHLY